MLKLIDVFFFDSINIFIFFVFIINLFFLFYSLFLKKNRSIYFWYVLHLFFITGWMLALAFFRFQNTEKNALNVAFWLYFLPYFIPITFNIFLVKFKKEIFKKIATKVYFLSIISLLAIFVIPNLFIGVDISNFTENRIVFFNFYNLIYNVFVIFNFSLMFYLIFFWYKNTTNEEEKKQSTTIFWGNSISVSFSLLTNLILPSVGVSRFQWIGPISVIFFTSFTFYSVLKYNLFQIKINFSKFIKYVFFSFYGYATFYILTYFYTKSFGSVWSREALTVGVGVAPLFAYILFKIDKITDTINYFIFGNLNRHQDILETILNYVNSNLEDDKIIKFVDEVLSGFFESSGTHVLNLPSNDEVLNKQIKEVFKEKGEVYIIEDNNYLSSKLKNAYCGVKFSTKINNEYLFYVENKRDDAMYSKQDLNLIKSVANQLEYAIDRSDLYKKTKDLNIELEKEVSLRTAELQTQKRTLQSMLEEKEETLHVVAHQIKTPLSVMNSAYEMWKDGLWSPEKAGGVVKQELDRMRDTINVFFKAQQRDLKNKEVNVKLNDLTLLVEEIIKEKSLIKKVREGKVKIIYDKDFKNIEPFYFDSNNLTEVISNVIDNAIAYTKSEIILKTRIHENGGRKYVDLIIQDNGIGIEKEDVGKLFERFVRTDNAIKTRPDGSGLGLYVCKQIMILMHGKIWVESEGAGKGSTFYISLPFNKNI